MTWETRPRISELVCCFVEVAVAELLANSLDVPAIQFISSAGEAPQCVDKEYVAAYVDPGFGITPYQGRSEDSLANDRSVSRRQVTVTLDVGILKRFLGDTETADNCGQLLGTCVTKDDVGASTFSSDAARATDYLDVLTMISPDVQTCFCSKGPDLGFGAVPWSCLSPTLLTGVVLGQGLRNIIRTRWTVVL